MSDVSLGAGEPEEGLKGLVDALEDEDAIVKESAARNWFSCSRKENKKPFRAAVKPLVTMLSMKECKFQARSAWTLQQIGPTANEALPALVTAFEANTTSIPLRDIEEALIQVGPGNRNLVIPLLTQTFRRELIGDRRATILWIIRRIGNLPDSLLPTLIAALGDSSWEVRRIAAIALATRGHTLAMRHPHCGLLCDTARPAAAGAIACALFRITGNHDEAMPVLLHELPERSGNST